ncbi:MAG: hypothetical protein WCO69_06170 [Candidatus Omnitrophota bacterium]
MVKILLLLISLLAAAPVWASTPDNDAAVSAALDRMSEGGEAPRWRSSLGDIEQATSVLVEANRKLTSEYQSLSARLDSFESDLAAQQKKNAQIEADIAERRAVINTPVSSSPEKQKLTQAGKDVREAKLAADAAQARLKAVDSKLDLRRLKAQELEIEKKSLLMDRGARAVSTLGTLKQSIAALKDQVESQKGQIDYVSKKIADLKSVDRPFLKDASQLVAENAKLKDELTPLMVKRGDLLKQVDAAVEAKNKAGMAPEAKKSGDLAARKMALETRLAAAQSKKEERDADIKASAVDREALGRQTKDLEAENKRLEEQMGNVRENIAVLEYRMNSMTRYKNRNQHKD